jgi:hypothetical protein
MKTVDAIKEAIAELSVLAEKEMNTFEYNRLRLIIQELEKIVEV